MAKKKRPIVINPKFIIGVLIFAAIIGVGAVILPPLFSGGEGGGEGAEAVQEVEQPIILNISCAGDVMTHSPQLKAQKQSDGTYNFDNNFEYIKGYIQAADLAICNLETTFGGEPYSGYPLFCTPDELAASLTKAGFDLVITANNHMMDSGTDGVKRTLQVLHSYGFPTSGSNEYGEPDYAVVGVNGVNVGLVAYTYETSQSASQTSINGNNISDEAAALINSFNYHDLDNDMAKIKADVEAAKAAGAEIIICYMHWGEEYQREPNANQIDIAQRLADMGADVILASHPHVLQPVGTVTGPNTGRTVPIFWSMGNFLSNQRQESLGNRYTEQGMLANVRIEYMKSTGRIQNYRLSVMPTWVDRSPSGDGRQKYSIIPLDDYLDYNEELQSTGHLGRAQQALEDVKQLIGDSYIGSNSVEFPGPTAAAISATAGGLGTGVTVNGPQDGDTEFGDIPESNLSY